MSERKIIQIAVEAESSHTNTVLYALCDDGSVWWAMPHNEPSGWHEIPPIGGKDSQ